jgi:hypothetical protein
MTDQVMAREQHRGAAPDLAGQTKFMGISGKAFRDVPEACLIGLHDVLPSHGDKQEEQAPERACAQHLCDSEEGADVCLRSGNQGEQGHTPSGFVAAGLHGFGERIKIAA